MDMLVYSIATGLLALVADICLIIYQVRNEEESSVFLKTASSMLSTIVTFSVLGVVFSL